MIKCFSILNGLVKTAEKSLGKVANKEAVHWMHGVCDMIDTIANAYDGTEYEISIDDETFDINISLVCGEITVDGYEEPNHFYEVAEASKKMYIKCESEDTLVVTFQFDSVLEDVVEQ